MAEVNASPVIRPISEVRIPKRLSIDDLADTALARGAEETSAKPPKAAKPGSAGSVEDLLDEVMPSELEETQPADNEDGEHDQDDNEDSEVEVDTRGSKEDPFKVSDLPKDKFIKIKVDGEDHTVTVAELAAGYVREKVFHQRIERLQGHTQQLEALVKDANDSKAGVRQEIVELFGDPERLHELLRSKFEHTLHEVAKRRAADVAHWEKYPGTRERFMAEEQAKATELQRQAFAAEQEAAQRTQREQAVIEQRVKVLRPGWLEGLRQAGNPTPDAEFTQMVGAVMQQQIASTGKALTSEDVAKIVVRVAKLLGAKPASSKPVQPAQVIGGRRAQPANNQTAGRSGGRKDFSQMSAKQRRDDPDFFLQSFKGLR